MRVPSGTVKKAERFRKTVRGREGLGFVIVVGRVGVRR